MRPKPPGDVLEAGDGAARLVGPRGHGERGGGEYDRAVGLEERGGKELGDVDGRGLEVGVVADVADGANPLLRKCADPAGGAALDPEDGVGVLRFEQELEVGCDVGGALAQAGRLVDVLQAVELALEEAEGVERSGVGVAALFQELGALVEGHAAEAGVGADVGGRVECGDGVRGGVCGCLERSYGSAAKKRRARSRRVAVALSMAGVEACLARSMVSTSRASSSKRCVLRLMPKKLLAMSSSSCASSKMTAPAAGRTPASGAAPACSLIAMSAKKRWWLTMTISRLKRLAAHGGDEAVLPVGTGLAEACLAARVQLGPERGVLRQRVDLRAVAGRGGLLPGGDGVELADLVEARQQRRIAQRIELVPAQVVAAALHIADLERAEDRFEEGNVLEEELLLQVFGSGRDDDALLAIAGQAQRGQQVGERLAGSRACLHDQMALVGEGLLDGAGHLVLALAMLELQAGAREQARGREEVVERRELALGDVLARDRKGLLVLGLIVARGDRNVCCARDFSRRRHSALLHTISSSFGSPACSAMP